MFNHIFKEFRQLSHSPSRLIPMRADIPNMVLSGTQLCEAPPPPTVSTFCFQQAANQEKVGLKVEQLKTAHFRQKMT